MNNREEQHQRLALAVERAAESVMMTDAAGVIHYVNPAFTRLTGFNTEEALGRTPKILSSGFHDQDFYREMWSRLTAGQVFRATFTNRRKDGELYYFEQSITPLVDDDGRMSSYISTGRDITEQRLMQARVQQQDKMAAVGHLAAGVAHEVGNPLTAISMVLQSLERKLDDPYVLHKLEIADQHIQRISSIVRRMVDFAQPPRLERRPCSLNSLIRETVEILRYDRRGKHLHIDLDLADDLPPVIGVRDQLMQALLNLGMNALDSLETVANDREPRLAVSTGRRRNGRGETLWLEWKDNGRGIASNVHSKIFEPFITTKTAGHGAGLGLSVCYGIIEEHGGSIRAESVPGVGASFFVELPVESSAG